MTTSYNKGQEGSLMVGPFRPDDKVILESSSKTPWKLPRHFGVIIMEIACTNHFILRNYFHKTFLVE